MSLSSMNRILAPYNNQNGVMENPFCRWNVLAPGGTAAAGKPSSKTRPEDELDNCVADEVDNSSSGGRSPQANGKPAKNINKNRLVLKNNHFPASTNEDGSQPSTPGSSEDCMTLAEYHEDYSRLGSETRDLLGQYFRIYAGLCPRGGRNNSKALATLTRVGNDIIGKHHITYNGMLSKLSLDERGDDMSFVTELAETMFNDGVMNWGRVVSLVAFGATVCKHLKETGREPCVDLVAENMSTYLLDNKKEWLLNSKGWDGFVEFFHVEDPETVVRNALMAFASVASIGAGLAYLIR